MMCKTGSVVDLEIVYEVGQISLVAMLAPVGGWGQGEEIGIRKDGDY